MDSHICSSVAVLKTFFIEVYAILRRSPTPLSQCFFYFINKIEFFYFIHI